MVVGDMGWVDYDLGHSTACQVLLRQIWVWQNGWVTGQDGETSQPNPCPRPPLSPCTLKSFMMSEVLYTVTGADQGLSPRDGALHGVEHQGAAQERDEGLCARSWPTPRHPHGTDCTKIGLPGKLILSKRKGLQRGDS